MENGLRQEKSTGYTQSTATVRESAKVQPDTTESEKDSPVLITAPTKVESTTSTAEVSPSKILAIQILLGDFNGLKKELPVSRQTSSNGKIYWCAEMPGHVLSVENGKLLVDGVSADILLEKLLA